MKRLKYACPFGGKQYPIYLALAAAFLSPLLSLSLDWELAGSLSTMVWIPLCVLIICFLFEQHLTPDERAIIAELEPPLWNIATQELIDKIRIAENKDAKNEMVAAGIIAAVICLLATAGFGFSEFTIVLCLLIVLGCIFAFLYTLKMSQIWAQIDDSAVFIDVPIHHIYDVTHRSSRRQRLLFLKPRIWYESYLVFYLHDGRYVLHAPKGSGDAKTIRLIKFRNHIRWMLQE
ncbi:MAG: hypothetical protein IKM30_06185 [Oscillospiraceae bacterium]|nr:hypothetical protein [Oscillospiraceae bacterium]